MNDIGDLIYEDNHNVNVIMFLICKIYPNVVKPQ